MLRWPSSGTWSVRVVESIFVVDALCVTSTTAKCIRSCEVRGCLSYLQTLSCKREAEKIRLCVEMTVLYSYSIKHLYDNNVLTLVEKYNDGFSVGGKSWKVSWKMFCLRWTSTVLFIFIPWVTRGHRFSFCGLNTQVKYISNSVRNYISPAGLLVT